MAQIMFYSFANIFKLCWSTRRNEGNSRPFYNKTSNYVTSKWEVAWQCPTTSSPTTYSSEGDQMHPTQGTSDSSPVGGSRSPVTRTRPPVPPVKSHPAVKSHLSICLATNVSTFYAGNCRLTNSY